MRSTMLQEIEKVNAATIGQGVDRKQNDDFRSRLLDHSRTEDLQIAQRGL